MINKKINNVYIFHNLFLVLLLLFVEHFLDGEQIIIMTIQKEGLLVYDDHRNSFQYDDDNDDFPVVLLSKGVLILWTVFYSITK